MVTHEVEAGRRDQGCELLDELLGLEDDVGRAVAPAVLELAEEPPVLHPREAFGGDRRAGHVAAEALEAGAIAGRKHEPRVLTLETQDAILAAIPETDRGIFLALARMGLRPGEAVALEAGDYQDGWLHVTRALKGRRLSDPVRAPKNNRGKRLPVDPELQAWIERHVPAERRIRGGLLFENARGKDPARRWTPTSLHRRWEAACGAVGLSAPISLYEGTKHTFATNAKRRGVEDRLLQRFLGHRDRRSVERYARLADEALIAVLRPLRPTPESDGLSPACRQAGERSRKPSKPQGSLVEAAGIEPASAWCPLAASTCVALGSISVAPGSGAGEAPPRQTCFSPPDAVCQRRGASSLMTPATR